MLRFTFTAVIALCALARSALAQEVWPDPGALPQASYPNVAQRDINLGHGVVAHVRFELTEKGNGGLTIPGFGIRVYDAQRDGVTYRNYLLTCEWKDTNADGYLDLVVTGTAQIWTDKGDRIEIEKSLTAVFAFDPATKRFSKVQCPPEIFVWPNRETATERPTTPEK